MTRLQRHYRYLFKLYALLVLIVFLGSGCADFLKNLRKDFDDRNESALAEDTEDDSDDPRDRDDRRSPASAENSEEKERGFRQGDSSSQNSIRNYNREPLSSATVSNLPPEIKRMYKNGSRATRDDFIDQSQEEGSLWASNGQTNYYFTKNKIRNPGDFISLTIENDLFREIGEQVKKTLTPNEKINEVRALQEQKDQAKALAELQTAKKDSIPLSAAAPDRTPAAGATPAATPSAPADGQNAQTNGQANTAGNDKKPDPVPSQKMTFSDVNIFSSLEVKSGETMMGEILERYPNGNYKVRAFKRIPYKRGPSRMVSVIGVVKGADINDESDTISSAKLYESRVEVAH